MGCQLPGLRQVHLYDNEACIREAVAKGSERGMAAEMNLPGLGLHALKGDEAGRFAVTVSRNWRITFAFAGEDAVEVDLEDDHGR